MPLAGAAYVIYFITPVSSFIATFIALFYMPATPWYARATYFAFLLPYSSLMPPALITAFITEAQRIYLLSVMFIYFHFDIFFIGLLILAYCALFRAAWWLRWCFEIYALFRLRWLRTLMPFADAAATLSSMPLSLMLMLMPLFHCRYDIYADS